MLLMQVICMSVIVLISKSIFILCDCVKNKNEVTCSDVQEISDRMFKESVQTLQNVKSIKINNANQKFQIQNGALASGTNLTSFTVTFADLKKLWADSFEDLPELKLIHISYVNLIDMYTPTFSNLPKLNKLFINNNKLKAIRNGTFVNLPSLEELYISNNELASLEDGVFGNLPNLQRLKLNGNRLKTIYIHKIITYPEKLEILWLQNNSLTGLSNFVLQGLSNLRVLQVGFNKISHIESDTFSQTPKLQNLVLTHNELKEIDGEVFPKRGMNYLETVYIDHNYLMFLKSSFFVRLSGLKQITLMENPWYCACLTKDIYRFLSENVIIEKCQEMYVDGGRPVCIQDDSGSNECSYIYNSKLSNEYREFKIGNPLKITNALKCMW